jgi:methylated-DNA-[protein]-cysteine S-methyltransferase
MKTQTAATEVRRWTAWIESPVGLLEAVAAEQGLTELRFLEGTALQNRTTRESDPHPILKRLRVALDAYFEGEPVSFDLPLSPEGTAFQKRCWAYLTAIPAGETRSYARQARELGDPKAVRAVGGANGRNPIAIVIPCHRVIGSGGSLVGYGGGLDRKKWLLDHERQFSSLFRGK